MRQRIIWSVALAATLCFKMGVVHAAGASFDNVALTMTTPVDKTTVPSPAAKSPIVFAAEMFGGSGIQVPTTNHMAVVYTIDGTISETFNMTFTLTEGAQFVSGPELFIQRDIGGVATVISTLGTADATYPIAITGGTASKEEVEFSVKALPATGAAIEPNLTSGDRLYLAYQIDNTSVLATPGQEIKMQVKLATPLGVLVNPGRTVSIATSKEGTKFELLSEPLGKVNISVADGETLFSGEGGAFVSSDEIILGYIAITNAGAGVYASDAMTPWEIGVAAPDAKVNSTSTTLTIDKGQFAASMESPGKVYIQAGSSAAATITEEDGNFNAKWELSDSVLASIVAETKNKGKVDIRLKVDGVTPINSVENAPEAVLNVDYTESNYKDATLGPVTLRKFVRDGTVCRLYNIPGANAGDVANVRIYNDSNTAAEIKIMMWDQDGNVIIPSDGSSSAVCLKDCDPIPPQAVWHINAAALEALAGGPWSKRGVVEINTTLPKIDVYALLRDKSTDIISNMSVGASGEGCESK